jgi:cyanate permease
MSIFEIIMLICFGSAWPFALAKSWRSRQTGGKSLGFLVIVFVGYLSGVIHKYLNSRDPVIFLYALNAVMVGADIILFARNRRIEKKKAGA